MMTYLISYELSNPLHRRHQISEAMMCIGESWARPLENTWYIRSKEDEDIITEKLGRLIDEDDALLIQTVDDEVTLLNTTLQIGRAHV